MVVNILYILILFIKIYCEYYGPLSTAPYHIINVAAARLFYDIAEITCAMPIYTPKGTKYMADPANNFDVSYQ